MTDQEQLLKSMVDHPAGRHRRQPPTVDCLGPNRMDTPGDLPPFAWVLMEIVAVLVILGLVVLTARMVWQSVGLVGVAGLALAVVAITGMHLAMGQRR